jgi:peptidoglycan hydrolase CwlO-like protein
MSKQSDTHRAVEETDLQLVDRAIADHEVFQKDLYVLRRVLTEIGKLDIASVRRGVQAEQDRLDEVRKQADAAQQQLDQLSNHIKDKQREVAEVESTIKERTVELNQLHEGYHNLRRMLEAA